MRSETDNASGSDNIPGPHVLPLLDLSQVVFLIVVEVVAIILVPWSGFFRWCLQFSKVGAVILDQMTTSKLEGRCSRPEYLISYLSTGVNADPL